MSIPMKGRRTSLIRSPFGRLRIDPELAEAVRVIAAANFRSQAEQILYWVHEAVKAHGVPFSSEPFRSDPRGKAVVQ